MRRDRERQFLFERFHSPPTDESFLLSVLPSETEPEIFSFQVKETMEATSLSSLILVRQW